jgi:L-alanine-DL-glutamate epimerase-like enolase superfamily enzyme
MSERLADGLDRRQFLTSAAFAGAGIAAWPSLLPAGDRSGVADAGAIRDRTERILAAAARPALRQELLPASPLTIERVELLKNGPHFLVRVRTSDGAEGLSVAHGRILSTVYPHFVSVVAPLFVGMDARRVEENVEAVYRTPSHYKWQGLAFWACVAAVELAMLDLIGKVTSRSLTDYFGDGRVTDQIAVYRASGTRGNAPEEEVDFFRQQIEEIGARAIKYRLGARMHYDEASTRRDRALIPLMRDAFPDVTLYADANSSYDVPTAIEIAHLMEQYDYAFLEEPVAFDHYDETRAVTSRVAIPIAGGEQEFSLRHFLWQIDHEVLDLVQPDIFYFGGMTRSLRVGRGAQAVGMTCTPHISGEGLGFLYAVLLAASMPNAGPYHEYKGVEADLPAEPIGGTFIPENGILRVPTGPGLGFRLDPDFLARAEIVR